MEFDEGELIILSQAFRLREMVMIQTARTRKDFEAIGKTTRLKHRFMRELRGVRNDKALKKQNERAGL